MSRDLKEAKDLLRHARELRRPHEDELRDAFAHILPDREFDREPGQAPDRTRLYDSSATAAAHDLVTNVLRLLIPQNRQWASIVLASEPIKQTIGSQIAPYLAAANDTIFKHFTDSNFFPSIGESLLDTTIGGTGCIAFIDEIGKPLSYLPVPINQIFFCESYDGRVDVVFREHHMTSRQILARFGDLSASHKDLFDQPDKRHKIIESSIPDGASYRYCIYLEADWSELETARTRWSPFLVWRWMKTLGEVWGSGPGRVAIPHIRAINQMVKSSLAHGEYAAFGLWQIDDTSIDLTKLKDRMKPGSVIAVDGALQPVSIGGNFQISLAMIDREAAQIRNLMLSSSLPPSNRPSYMTAEEVIARRDEFLQRVGQPAQRLQWELLQPLATQVVGRLTERGELPRIPVELLETLQAMGLPVENVYDVFRLEVNAAIRQAIKLSEAQEDVRALQVVAAALGEAAPALIGKHVDLDKMTRKLLDNMSFSTDLLRSPAEVKRYEEQQAQAQAAMAQAAMVQQGAQQVDAAATAATKVKELMAA